MGAEEIRRSQGTSRLTPLLRRIEWGLLIALVIGLVAAGPFLARASLPRGTDAELHVFRAAELGYALEEGNPYPRWAPNLFLGYGYPIFNYYAPLTYYLANLFASLPGVGIVTGVKAVFVVGCVLASIGAYALGRELFGASAGVIAAASFAFAPYVVLIDPHARGDLAEHFAVCLLPTAFYAFHRLMSGRGGRGVLAGAVLSLAAVVASHNLIGLIAALLLGGYWVWELVAGFGRDRWYMGVLSFGLAAAISAFFWLPALAEWSAVELVVVGPGHFDFRNHFVSLAELLSPSPVLDLAAASPDYRFNFGLAQWILALPALVALRIGWVRRRVGYFVLVAVGLGLIMMRASLPLWERLPPMAYLQFPWRLLGPASMALAVCAAGATTLLPPTRWRSPVLAAGLAALLVSSLPALYPPMWSAQFGSTEPEDIIAWEAATGALGTTSTRDFVPEGAALVPMRPTDSLVASYSESDVIDKVNRATVPDGASVVIADHGPGHDLLHVSSPVGFVLRLYTFDFPGWRAYVDDVETEIEVAYPEGFITVPVPAGDHEVLVRFEDTPPRTIGWLMSALGILGLVAGAVLLPHHGEAAGGRPEVGPGAANPIELLWLAAIVGAFLVLKIAVVDPRDDLMRFTSPAGQARPAPNEVMVVFGDEIALIGFDIGDREVASGDSVEVTLYWRAVNPPTVDYQSFVHLANPLNVIWGQEDHLNPGEIPTTRWPADKYVRDEYEVRALPGTPPGEYVLNVGLYSMAGGYRLEQTSPGSGPEDSVVIGKVLVKRPHRQPGVDDLGITHDLNAAYSDAGVTLLGYERGYWKVDKGEAWTITFFWHADRDAPPFAQRDLVVISEDGTEAFRISGIPGGYPAHEWLEGDMVRDPVAVPPAIDVGLDPGRYQLAIVVHAGDGADAEASQPLVIGKLKVRDR